ncbi:MAG: hypothetical protein UV05_C0058G0003 [candidate division CPR1 bacterium GW2011_GWA2_42_17]|uniref:Uncharacterized protein n=1 Tax=candidate division CPR1 bacterium GW2011_GWA2_42_17 TaxID=1618341 RepID=A0A0G1BUX8_9BACT|nr:MAG: hypothetical protein UV05_C0058G0003 [candidate division CPR1 bacterium GW2011_GWA2_42_17]
MANLTETAHYARKAIKFSAVGLVSIIILRISWGIFFRWWIAANPPILGLKLKCFLCRHSGQTS